MVKPLSDAEKDQIFSLMRKEKSPAKPFMGFAPFRLLYDSPKENERFPGKDPIKELKE